MHSPVSSCHCTVMDKQQRASDWLSMVVFSKSSVSSSPFFKIIINTVPWISQCFDSIRQITVIIASLFTWLVAKTSQTTNVDGKNLSGGQNLSGSVHKIKPSLWLALFCVLFGLGHGTCSCFFFLHLSQGWRGGVSSLLGQLQKWQAAKIMEAKRFSATYDGTVRK